MSSFPIEGWNHHPLNELGFVGRGKSRNRPRNDPSLYGGKYPFIQTAEIKAADLYISEFTNTYNDKGLAQSKLWEPGTLCITIAANIAETAILKIPACFPDSVVGFVADHQQSDVLFIKYSFDILKQQMQNISRGTTQDNFSLDKLLTFDFLTPPLPTQRKIAAILSAYDDLIENNLRRIKILEEIAQNIYREWFVKFRFPGHEKVKMVDSELGMIPEGWTITPIGQKFTTRLGGTPSRIKSEYWTNGTIAWVNSSKVNEIRIVTPSELITEEALDHSSTKIMPKRTTVIAITGATLGQVSLLEIEACANQSVVGIIDPSKLYSEYMYLKIKEIIGELINKASGGAQQHINKEIVNAFSILLPPETLAVLFSEKCKPIFSLITNNLFQNYYLSETRDLLLPKLISGEIDVSNLGIKVEEAT
jgi:type I restriction enzyme S subunit